MTSDMLLKSHILDCSCDFCDAKADFDIGATRVCMLHFSVLRLQMMGRVLQEHAFVMRNP
jgi:hypothetical protein